MATGPLGQDVQNVGNRKPLLLDTTFCLVIMTGSYSKPIWGYLRKSEEPKAQIGLYLDKYSKRFFYKNS